jgi:phosphoribosyl 1,2-cyclic phosphate phosphodiesterase
MARLAIEFLGTSGAIRTPRPSCHCDLCRNARRLGHPWERTGPSVFVHGPDVLIDTPEESAVQINRAGIDHIAAGLYSHWHPDHTAGRRMYETRNWDFRHWPPQHLCTPIYLPPRVARDFQIFMGLAENFAYLQEKGLVALHVLDGPVEVGGWRITARPLAADYVYLFLFEEMDGGRRVLIAMDELVGWIPPDDLSGVDLAILPCGIFEFNPLTGQRHIPRNHPILQSEATFRQTLQMVERLQPKRLFFTHIEESEQLSPPQLAKVALQLKRQRGWSVTFAHDTLVVQL